MPPVQKFCEQLGFATCGDPELAKLASAAQHWWTDYRDGAAPRWLTLIGTSGAGKTHVARKLWQWASARADFSPCAFTEGVVFWPDFVDELRSGNAYDRYHDMKRWPVLFLDDIGAERDPNGFSQEKLTTLLCCRMDRWTLLTSNLSPEALKAIDTRIFSRMIRGGNVCVSVNTMDYSER